jgi:predicted DNA-binding transcriptional regulator AlpA
MNDKLMNEEGLAEWLGISQSAIAKMRVRGDGPRFLKLGRRVAYDPADVQAWLDARRVNSTSELAA